MDEMKATTRIFGAGLAFASGLVALAGDEPDPYKNIASKNVFRLKPPVQGEAVQPSPRTRVFVEGFITIGGQKRVLLKLQPLTGRDNTCQDSSRVLAEGEHEGDLEVVKIRGDIGVVTIRNGEFLQVLDLNKNAAAFETRPPVRLLLDRIHVGN